jgi:hypothetical protein
MKRVQRGMITSVANPTVMAEITTWLTKPRCDTFVTEI